MSNKIKIIIDSTCDIEPELIEKYDIGVIPHPVSLGDEMHLDMVDVTPDDIYEFVGKTNVLAKTSAINIPSYSDFWKPFIDEGYDIINFHIGSGFSSTYNNAVVASENYPGRVHLIDSENLSSGIALLVLIACEGREKGLSIEEIVAEIKEAIPKVRSSFLVGNIDYLYKGGRCSGLAAFGANLLKLKPCIEVIDNAMIPGKKYRGKDIDAFAAYAETKLKDKEHLRKNHVFITHSGIDQKIVDTVYEKVKELQDFENIHFCRASCTISTHCGYGTLGVLFIDDAPTE